MISMPCSSWMGGLVARDIEALVELYGVGVDDLAVASLTAYSDQARYHPRVLVAFAMRIARSDFPVPVHPITTASRCDHTWKIIIVSGQGLGNAGP